MSGAGRRSAVALAYDKNDDRAPRVVAKGYGEIAEMIVQRARDAGLYVHESSQMVSLLMNVNLDSQVPPLLYQAVAELLAWLYRLETDQAAASLAAKPAPAPKKGGRPKPGNPAGDVGKRTRKPGETV